MPQTRLNVDSRRNDLVAKLMLLEEAMAPAPWHVGAVSDAIRHVQRNTEVMEDAVYIEGGTGNLPDRYDGGLLAELRNLLPEIILALKAAAPPPNPGKP